MNVRPRYSVVYRTKRHGYWGQVHYSHDGQVTLCGKQIPDTWHYSSDKWAGCDRCARKWQSEQRKEGVEKVQP